VGLKSLKSLNLTNGYPNNKNNKNKNNKNNKVKSKPLELFELAGKKLLIYLFICVHEYKKQRPDISFFVDIISYPYPGPIKGYYILSLSRQKKSLNIFVKRQHCHSF
jgi:hypothetical protein